MTPFRGEPPADMTPLPEDDATAGRFCKRTLTTAIGFSDKVDIMLPAELAKI
jgi:hypothetical protein